MSSVKQKPDCFLSFADVAELIALDEKTIRNGQCGTDKLLKIELGGRTVFSFNNVQEWMAEQIATARKKAAEKRDNQNKATAKIQLLQRPVMDRAQVNRYIDR